MTAHFLLHSADMSVDLQTLFSAGAHFGFGRGRRHPTASPFIFATKDRTDIFDLEATARCLEKASEFVRALAQKGGVLLIVGGKHEATGTVKSVAESIGVPYVAGRWIGGTLTNFKNIRKRIDRLQKLLAEREGGELGKYTKLERLLIDREIEELQSRFGGLVTLTDLPAALFVIDSRHEETAVKEANQLGIPVVGLANSDCDFSRVQYPIPANDTSVRSIRLIAETIGSAYQEGKRAVQKVEVQ